MWELLNQKLGLGPPVHVGLSPPGDSEAHSNLRITAIPHTFPSSRARSEKSLLHLARLQVLSGKRKLGAGGRSEKLFIPPKGVVGL